MRQPLREQVFISYSHKDKKWLAKLQTMLKPLVRNDSIIAWDDTKIEEGAKWEHEIQGALATAKVAVLLVSPDYLASGFIVDCELPLLFQAASKGELVILWLHLSKCLYDKTELRDHQAAHDISKPLDSLPGAKRNEVLAAVCRKIDAVASPSLERTRGAPAPQAALSNLPERNLIFTGRERVFTQLQEALAARGRAALSGLGGIGKTETAVEYAYRHLDEYAYTLWATADSQEAIASDYAIIAGLLKLPESDAKDQTLAVKAVKHWLSSHQGWLLILDNVILDNADELRMVSAFLPSGKNGHVLLTIQAQAVGAIAPGVDIQEMEIDEAARFLLRRAGALDKATEADWATAREIQKKLGGLPLALDQAGAYIEETGCGLTGYLNLYQNHASELLGRRGKLAARHLDPVASTWVLSFKKIEQKNPAAAELLRICAFLDPDWIPEELFSLGASELGPAWKRVGSDASAFNGAVSELLKYSLIYRDPNARTLEMHRLVQTVLKQGMDEVTQRLWAKRVVLAVAYAFPSVEFSTWSLCERLLDQVHACAALINKWNFEFNEAARLLDRAGFYSFERGRYPDAEPLFKRALSILEHAPWPKHTEVADVLRNLAVLYRRLSRYKEAEPLFKRALSILENELGPEHAEVADVLRNLAVLYRRLSRYKEAEPLFKRALSILENAPGPDHTEVPRVLRNLAMLYYHDHTRHYKKAENLYRRALSILKKASGPERPEEARILHNLGVLYYAQGRYSEVEPLYQRARAILEKTLGPAHSHYGRVLCDLAELYRRQGRYAEAEEHFKEALSTLEDALGQEHREVARCLEMYSLLLGRNLIDARRQRDVNNFKVS